LVNYLLDLSTHTIGRLEKGSGLTFGQLVNKVWKLDGLRGENSDKSPYSKKDLAPKYEEKSGATQT
jgi:hypothetical protein